MIGKIADDNSDVLILSAEDDHWEDPYEICKEIAGGITKTRGSILRIDMMQSDRESN